MHVRRWIVSDIVTNEARMLIARLMNWRRRIENKSLINDCSATFKAAQ